MKIYIVEDDQRRMVWFRKTFCDCEICHTQEVIIACNDIESNEYDIIFLDRDLFRSATNEDDEGNELTGEDVARYMRDNKLAENSAIIIHSLNPVGQINIKKLLDDYHPQVHVIPFNKLRKMTREDFIKN